MFTPHLPPHGLHGAGWGLCGGREPEGARVLSGNERNLAEVPPLTPCNVGSVAEPHKFS